MSAFYSFSILCVFQYRKYLEGKTAYQSKQTTYVELVSPYKGKQIAPV